MLLTAFLTNITYVRSSNIIDRVPYVFTNNICLCVCRFKAVGCCVISNQKSKSKTGSSLENTGSNVFIVSIKKLAVLL
jgi:hypothetical protein